MSDFIHTLSFHFHFPVRYERENTEFNVCCVDQGQQWHDKGRVRSRHRWGKWRRGLHRVWMSRTCSSKHQLTSLSHAKVGSFIYTPVNILYRNMPLYILDMWWYDLCIYDINEHSVIHRLVRWKWKIRCSTKRHQLRPLVAIQVHSDAHRQVPPHNN